MFDREMFERETEKEREQAQIPTTAGSNTITGILPIPTNSQYHNAPNINNNNSCSQYQQTLNINNNCSQHQQTLNTTLFLISTTTYTNNKRSQYHNNNCSKYQQQPHPILTANNTPISTANITPISTANNTPNINNNHNNSSQYQQILNTTTLQISTTTTAFPNTNKLS